MKNTILVIVLLFTLSILSTQSNAKDLSEYGMINGVSEEGLVKIDLPIVIAEKELNEVLKKKDSPFKKINFIKFDPINRTLALKGEIELPESLMFTLEEKAGHSLKKIHSFDTIIVFPSPSLLSASRYIQFKINKLVLDGVDYSKGFHIISRIVPALLVNRSFINYFLDESKAPTDYKETDLSSLIKELIDNKTIIMRDNTISIKFNLSQLTDLSRFSYLEELRLWHFSPILLKGTQDKVAFRIEAGLGKPGKNWVGAAKERQDIDREKLNQARSELYSSNSYSKAIEKELTAFISENVEKTGISNWNIRAKREIDDLKSSTLSKARRHLSMEDDLFVSDPVIANFEFFSEAKEYILNTIFDIKKRFVLENEKYEGGIYGKTSPVLTKRFSQNAINQFTNFFRDFEFDKEPLFKKLNVALAPHFPGVVIKGEVNLNINSLLAMGLEGSGIEFSSKMLRPDDKTYGEALPFELSLYTYMQDLSVLELDVKSATIGEGLNRVVLNNKSKDGDFLAEFVKMTIVNILKTYLISDPLATDIESAPTYDSEKLREALFLKIKSHNQNITSVSSNGEKSLIDDLINIKALELQNPFNVLPAQIAKQESIEFFKDVLGYDTASGRVLIRLDPSIISEKIMMAKNTIALWNFEPIFDKQMDKTYLEISVGDGIRSRDYLKTLKNRVENSDSQQFTGTSGDIKNEGIVDYNLKLSLSEFQNTANRILSASIRPQIEKIERELKNTKEGSFNVIEDITLNATKDNKLDLSFTLLSIEKSEKGFIRRFFSDENYEIKRQRARISAGVRISAEDVNKYKKEILEKNPSEVFLGSTLLKIDLDTVGRTIENPGLLGHIMNGMIGKVNLNKNFLGFNLKEIALNFMGSTLNAIGEESGNTVLGDIHINNFIKIFTHNKELLIQVNPRFAGPIWDFYIAKNQISNNREVGLLINKEQNTISFDFKSAFSLATVDKKQIYNIMVESRKLAKTLNKLDTKKLLFFHDKLFYNSDRSKRSLYHQFKDIVSSYDDIISISTNTPVDDYNLTSAGAELMHIAVVAKSLSNLIEDYLKLDISKSDKYNAKLREINTELITKYVKPLTVKYRKNFYENNRNILKSDITDWNHLIYPDAVFSQKSYDFISTKQD